MFLHTDSGSGTSQKHELPGNPAELQGSSAEPAAGKTVELQMAAVAFLQCFRRWPVVVATRGRDILENYDCYNWQDTKFYFGKYFCCNVVRQSVTQLCFNVAD